MNAPLNQLLTERDMDIAIMTCLDEVETLYQGFLQETLGNRMEPLPRKDISQAQGQLPNPAPAPVQTVQGPPPQAPDTGGY